MTNQDKLKPITDETIARIERNFEKADAPSWNWPTGHMIARIRTDAAEIKRLREALVGVTELYVELANSGDCGFWNPEEEPEIKQARAALKGDQP